MRGERAVQLSTLVLVLVAASAQSWAAEPKAKSPDARHRTP